MAVLPPPLDCTSRPIHSSRHQSHHHQQPDRSTSPSASTSTAASSSFISSSSISSAAAAGAPPAAIEAPSAIASPWGRRLLPPVSLSPQAQASPQLLDASTAVLPALPPNSKRTGHRRAGSNLTGALSRPQQRSAASGLLSLAAAALDRTQFALASLSEPVIRPTRPLLPHSNAAGLPAGLPAGLGRHSLNLLVLAPPSAPSAETADPTRHLSLAEIDSSAHPLPNSTIISTLPVPVSIPTQSHASARSDDSTASLSSLPLRPSSSATDSRIQTPSLEDHDPAAASAPRTLTGEMHQTSSRLLRMTDDERPFTKDLNDLFSTLIASLLPLGAHRVRLTKVEYTFLSEDAINNLSSLKFSQSNRMPDPKDPSRIVTTTTTTTFSMAKDMARSICQRFLEARFIESADGKYQQTYTLRGSVWQLTPKGISILDRFCAKNGIQQKQVAELAGNGASQLVLLERDQTTDKLLSDWGTVEVIFRRFVGTEGRNTKSTVTAADSDSLHDYKDGLTGVKMAAERKINGKIYRDTFTGKATADWLMDCSTIVDRREAYEIASLFVEHELMEPVVQDRTYTAQNFNPNLFQPSKQAIYRISNRGKEIINGNKPRSQASESDMSSPFRNGINRDSNTQRLERILNDPALRLLFRENLRDTHCEENLSFYKDVNEFVQVCKSTVDMASSTPGPAALDAIKEVMAQAYAIYNAFLAPGSPCELNIDHQLRNNLATRMTKAVGQEGGMIDTLREVTALFEDAQLAVFKLMASDSVPKFLRNVKYEHQVRSFDIDSPLPPASRNVERSNSRVART